jgi:iron complex outermembrane receptor protein
VAPGSLVMTNRRLREQTTLLTDYVYRLEPVWTVMTGTTKHTFVAGFEYQLQLLDAKRAEANLPNITNVFNPVIPEVRRAGLVFRPQFDRHIEANQYGLYAQDQIEFTEQWKVRVGLRADRFESEDFNRLSRPRKSRSDDELSGQAGLVYQPVKATSFFGGVSRSFVASLSSEGAARAPEKATQWELGNKTTLFEDRISLNLALFHVTREDFLVTIGTDQVPIGEQRTQGFELDLASEPLPGWKLYGNYAYQDTELTKLSPTDQSAGKGHRATGVPEHSAGLWTTYELQSGALRGLGFGGGLTYKASVFRNTLNTEAIPAYVVGDLVVFYRRAPFEVQVNVNNVADTTYFRNGSNNGGLPGEPLAVLGSLQVRY